MRAIDRRIESRGNPLIVQTAKLSSRKFREESSQFFFEGVHLLEEFLRFGREPELVFVSDKALHTYEGLLEQIPAEKLVSVSDSVFEKLSTEQAPQGILTVASFLDCVPVVNTADEVPGAVLLLESVRDNGNVGTVIRTAAALGCTCVLTNDCADIYAPKTVRATMGAMFSGCAAICENPLSFIQSFKKSGRRTFAAALGERDTMLGSFDIREDDCFVVGNEGQGISAELLQACSSRVWIPMTGKTESLNASAAASIILWEAAGKRLGSQIK